MKLADTNFKVLIEFDGKKWVRARKFNHIERLVNDTRKLYEYFAKRILLQDRHKRINEALLRLVDRQDWNKVKDTVKWSNLFETEEESIDHLCQLFGRILEEIVSKAFESGLLQRQKKTFTYLTLDPEKVQQFRDLIDN